MNNLSLKNWIRSEFHNISFHEKRLEKRFYKVAAGLAERSEKNICSSFESWKDVKTCYRFFSNEKVDFKNNLNPHRDRTLERIRKQKRVLLLQDTVYFQLRQQTLHYKPRSLLKISNIRKRNQRFNVYKKECFSRIWTIMDYFQ